MTQKIVYLPSQINYTKLTDLEKYREYYKKVFRLLNFGSHFRLTIEMEGDSESHIGEPELIDTSVELIYPSETIPLAIFLQAAKLPQIRDLAKDVSTPRELGEWMRTKVGDQFIDEILPYGWQFEEYGLAPLYRAESEEKV